MARRKCNRPPYKERFPSESEAEIARIRKVLNIKRHRKNAKFEEPTRSYKCEFCKGWHHTSQAKRSGAESKH